MNLTWQILSFEDLSRAQLYEILAIRQAVFVVEQYCPYLDADGLDEQSLHVIGTQDLSLVAYLRILPPGILHESCSIGRVLTVDHARGSGIGKELMLQGMAHCNALYPNTKIRISAQTYLRSFYENLGFVFTGKSYLEDGIPHLDMITP